MSLSVINAQSAVDSVGFTASAVPITLVPGDVILVEYLNSSSEGDPVVTTPADWILDASFDWTELLAYDFGGAPYVPHSFAGFYHKVWTSDDVQASYTAPFPAPLISTQNRTCLVCSGAAGLVSVATSGQIGPYVSLPAGIRSDPIDIDPDTGSDYQIYVGLAGSNYAKSSYCEWLIGVDSVKVLLGCNQTLQSGNGDYSYFYPSGLNGYANSWGFSGDIGSIGAAFLVGSAPPPPSDDIRISHNVRRARRLSVS